MPDYSLASGSSEADTLLYPFDAPPPTDQDEWAAVLGGKGAGLARMRAMGMPVPPGFTLPTSVCHRVLADGWFDDLDGALGAAITELELALDRRLGDVDRPLLVSVRSGAPVSMPGMMDTVLNVGITPEAAVAIGRSSGDDRFGWDTYRRFIEGYAAVVCRASASTIEETMSLVARGRAFDAIAVDELSEVLGSWRAALAEVGHHIPEQPATQITEAIQAVFSSWRSERAEVYRREENISADLGTAATVQAMVFGNLGLDSGTGVAFTRDPSSGASVLMGDFLVGAQGEDVVAGTHQTQPISEMGERWPELADELQSLATQLEHDLCDMVDIEFTVEERRLWLLQARVGKRSPRAAVRLAVAMADDPTFPLSRAEAVARVADLLDDPPTEATDEVVAAHDSEDVVVLATGLGASPGRVVGIVCLDPDSAVHESEAGQAVILIRPETSPSDIHGMAAARGLVTTLGGLVSHAAVVARSWGLPAVVGAGDIRIEADAIVAGEHRVPVGATVTVDGDHGRLLLGAHPGDGAELVEVSVLRRWLADIESSNPADPSGQAGLSSATVTDEECRRALALKGMATADAVADLLGVASDVAADTLAGLVEQGHASEGPGDRFLLTPDGTAAVEAAYEAESVGARPVIEAQLERFHDLNLRFKEVVTAWQMRDVDGESVMNDHTDPTYDGQVIDQLAAEIHGGICEVLDGICETVHRLEAYRARFEVALAALRGGDQEMMAHPLRDSYHTLWFELHEELIRLSGRNRADEAAAGRA